MKLEISESETYPDYYVRQNSTPNMEVDGKTWRRWRAAQRAYEKFQKEAQEVFEHQVGLSHQQRLHQNWLKKMTKKDEL